MIVACTGCTARFKVADDKVGPRGARLRCPKCQTVFTVHRDAPAVAAAPRRVPDLPPPPTPEPVATPGSAAHVEIDLEPAARRQEPDPFAPPSPDDPFAALAEGAAAAPSGVPPAPTDPFGTLSVTDPFAAVQAPIPPELLHTPPGASPAVPAPPLPGRMEGGHGAEADPFAALPPLGGAPPDGSDLSLEERTASRRPPRPQTSAPLEDPFASSPPQEAGPPSDIPPLASAFGGDTFVGFTGAFSAGEPQPPEPRPPEPPHVEAPLRTDPFAAAAVDAEPLQVASTRAAPAAPLEPGPRAVPRVGRLRAAAINAISLAVLLGAALALLVVWRGGLPLSEALHPSQLLAALGRGRDTGPFRPDQVTSGFYERAHGSPLLFVKGVIRSQAPAPVAAVRVSVDVTRDGRLVAHGEGRLGAVPSPEELYQAVDAAGLARLAAVAERAPAQVRPGETLPFLVVIADAPPDLAGATLRVTADGEAVR